MSNDWSPEGQCLCGEIQLKLNAVKPEVGVCHCKMCRQWSGSSYMSIEAGQSFEISESESLSIYDSSDWAQRGFCSKCGTHLFYRLKESNDHDFPVGLFEDTNDLVLDHEIFIDRKPTFFNFAEETKKITSAEVMAMFGTPQ